MKRQTILNKPNSTSIRSNSSETGKTGLIQWVIILLIAIVVTALSSQPSLAQQQDLFQILEQSKHNYPLIKAKQAEVHSAERKVQSAKSEYLPNLTVQDQYTYGTSNSVTGAYFPNEGTALSPSGGIRPDNIYQATFGSFTSALMEWKVINFGKVAANVQTARNERNKTQADYENELFQHQVRVADAYLLTLISQKLVDIQRNNVERTRTVKGVVEAGVVSGMRPGVDSSLANAEYTKAQLLLLESERNEKAQRLRLSELTGILQDSIQVDSMAFYTQLPAQLLSVQANENNPVLRLYNSQIRVSEARSVAIRRSFLPSVSLIAAGWARGSGISNQDDSYHTDMASGFKYQVYNYMFGISTRWNLTSFFRIHNDFRSEQFQAQRYKELYNQQSLAISRQLKEAQMQVQLSLEQARLAPVQLEAARAAYNQSRSRYQSGLADLPTFIQSFFALNRAEVDRIVANSSAWRSVLLQAAAAGDLSLFLNQVK
ncbi:TolC family protein [Rhodocytophaga rosea]|uniref:TolC family protein n=2 Tax=Rhodocytophaga rosea TaxID=2704465 RepID=A0A6C0GVG1_9BACT|nr:TolC family protein [Rhodocytophaga rosea]